MTPASHTRVNGGDRSITLGMEYYRLRIHRPDHEAA